MAHNRPKVAQRAAVCPYDPLGELSYDFSIFGIFCVDNHKMLSIILFMMTYAQRQLLNRILFWIGLFIVVVCGAYILYEAYLVENYPHVCKKPALSVTYLMGRSSLQIASYTLCSVLVIGFVYRYLLLSGEDRATVETDPSASDCQDTAAGLAG